MYKETGLIRRQYMKLSIGSIAAECIGWRVFCLTLLQYTDCPCYEEKKP